MAVTVENAISYLTLDKTEFNKNLKSAGGDLENFINHCDKSKSRIKSLGDAMTSIGKGISKPSIEADKFLRQAIKTASDFQDQMSKVQNITGTTDSKMKELSNTAREWGSKTEFGAKEAGQAMEHMAMAGWKTQDIMDQLPKTLNLATVSGQDLGATTDMLARCLNDFGMKAKDAGQFSDLLVQASSKSATNVSLLGEALKICGPEAKKLGMSAKDVTFGLGLMANAGIKGSKSGTALKKALTNLSNPTNQMKKAMRELGISFKASNGKIKSGKALYDQLRQKFSKLTTAQKKQYATTLFGKDAMKGMLAIINSSNKDYNKLYKNLNNCNGASDKMAKISQNKLKGALKVLKGAFQELQIALAKGVIPILTRLVKMATKIINGFNKLPAPVKKAIGLVIGAIALLSPAFLVLGKLISGVRLIIKVFSTLRKAAGVFKFLAGLISIKTLIIVGAIAGIGLIIYEVIKHWDQLKKAAKNLWKGIVSIFKKIGKFFHESILGWKYLFSELGKKFLKIGKDIALGLLNGLKKGFEWVKNFVGNMATKIKNKFKNLLGIHSPSVVFLKYGGFIGEGLLKGLEGQENLIYSKFNGLAGKIKLLGNVKPNFSGLNDFALSGANVKDYGTRNIESQLNKNMGITQNVKMYITIPNANKEGANKVASKFKTMTENSMKNVMTELFMNDVLRD